MKNKIILGHPFVGSLYKFFENQLSNHPHEEPILHPYYRDLFGRSYNYWNDLTFALFAIFDEIIIPPADAHIPDRHKYTVNDTYQNKELGLYSSWKDSFTYEIREQIAKDLENVFIHNLLQQYSSKEKEGILEYVRLYINLSQKYNCPVLCGGEYQRLFAYLTNANETYISNNLADNTNVSFTQTHLNLNVAAFNISSLDTLYEIKSDKEIKLYAKNYRKIIHQYGSTTKTETEIKQLLQTSLSKNLFYNRVSSILDTSSLVCSYAGFMPIIGVPFSVLSIGGTHLSKVFKNNKYNWYQLFYAIDKVDKDTKIKTL